MIHNENEICNGDWCNYCFISFLRRDCHASIMISIEIVSSNVAQQLHNRKYWTQNVRVALWPSLSSSVEDFLFWYCKVMNTRQSWSMWWYCTARIILNARLVCPQLFLWCEPVFSITGRSLKYSCDMLLHYNSEWVKLLTRLYFSRHLFVGNPGTKASIKTQSRNKSWILPWHLYLWHIFCALYKTNLMLFSEEHAIFIREWNYAFRAIDVQLHSSLQRVAQE